MNALQPDVPARALADHLQKTLRELGIDPAQRWLLGFSGGGDSMALLHLLHLCGFQALALCHLNHQLRGGESQGDADFTLRQGENYGLRVFARGESAADRAAGEKCSLEEAARLQRREFFVEAAREFGARGVFLAHHADDQAETCLHNLLRGTGVAGLTGMQPLSRLAAGQNGEPPVLCCRPLLPVWRDELREFLQRHDLPYREDSSNAALDFTRNRLRHSLIPRLEKELERPVRRALWRMSEILREEDALLRDLTALTQLAGREELPVADLVAQPLALQRRVLHQWFQRHCVPDVTFELIEHARLLLNPQSGVAKINLPGDRHLRRRQMTLFIEASPGEQEL
jgi:tRNA(Ile)-lysidine synthase